MTPTNFSIFRYYAKDLTRMNRKRATIIVSSLFAGALVAAACTATDSTVEGTATPAAEPVTAAPVATYSTPSYTPPTGTATSEDLFIAVLDDRNFPYGGDEDLAIEVGYSACDALDSGVSMVQLAAVTLEKYSPEDGGTFLGAAVGALCDEHMPKLEAFQAQFGGN